MPGAFAFPTALHQQAAGEIVQLFSGLEQVDAILLVNSCARGVATQESDLDIAVLLNPAVGGDANVLPESSWRALYAAHPCFAQLKQLGQFSGVHLDFFDGRWNPEVWDDGGGPDSFEIEIGNRVAYAAPLWERANAFQTLRSVWLPFYDKALQQQRLAMVRESCRLNVARLEFYVGRGLYFQAFDRLYHALQEFLQALFIAHAVYPIAYNKWIYEQVVNWLDLPRLYAELPALLEIHRLESDEPVLKGKRLLELLDTWARPNS